jgi:hypothetical protein
MLKCSDCRCGTHRSCRASVKGSMRFDAPGFLDSAGVSRQIIEVPKGDGICPRRWRRSGGRCVTSRPFSGKAVLPAHPYEWLRRRLPPRRAYSSSAEKGRFAQRQHPCRRHEFLFVDQNANVQNSEFPSPHKRSFKAEMISNSPAGLLRGRRPLSLRVRSPSAEHLRFPASRPRRFQPRPGRSALSTSG